MESFPVRPFSRKLLPLLVAIIIVLGGAATLFFRSSLELPTTFAQRQRVSATSVLHFSFPALMDHASVERELVIPSGLSGSILWENENLTFHPSDRLESGETYTFSLPGKALKADGSVLGRDLSFTFIVAGPPSVVVRLPHADGTDIDPASTITLVFDRPIIPLTQVQGEASERRGEDWPVTISPLLPGRWRWISTVAVEFLPEGGLSPATRYTVSVPKGIKTVSGDGTEEDFSWSFETTRPVVEMTDPKLNATLAGPTTSIAITFNQDMNPAIAKEFFTLYKEKTVTDAERTSSGGDDGANRVPYLPSSPDPSGETVAIGSIIFGKKDANASSYLAPKKMIEDKQTLVIVPASPLDFSAAYALKVSPGITGAEGDLGMASGAVLRFQTVGNLSLLSSAYEYGSLTFDFSNPLNAVSFDGAVSVTPEIEGWKDIVWEPQEWENMRRVIISPALRPSTTYTITFSTKIADTFGQHLKEPALYTFTTQPLSPSVSIDSKWPFGIFERGKPPVYRMSAVNVSELNVRFAPLPLANFLKARSGDVNQGNANGSFLDGQSDLSQWTIPQEKKQDKGEVTALDLEQRLGRTLAPGIYGLTVRAPEFINEWNSEPATLVQYFALTNIALTLKYSGDHALVWAVDMQSGENVPGALVTFLSLNGETVVTGKTDAEGFFETSIDLSRFVTGSNEWDPEFYVTAVKGDDFAFVGSTWDQGMEPYSFGFPTEFHSARAGAFRADAYVYTERPTYRAGDTVHFKGIVRLRDWNGVFSLPASDRRIQITVNDAEGNEIMNKELPFTVFGSFNGELPIDAKASLGSYYLSARVIPDGDIEGNYNSTTFNVLAYRKPEYKVTVTPAQTDLFNGDTVKATIEGAYYFGAPMANAHVSWRALSNDYYFNKFTDGWYSFALEEAWCWWNCMPTGGLIAQGEGTLDASGKLSVSFPADITEKGVSQIVSIEADITDENNQVVSNRESVIVHKAGTYVGIRADAYGVAPGSDAPFSLITVKPDGSADPNQKVTLSIYSRTWNTIRKRGVDGEYYYENEAKDTFIRSTSVTTNADGKASAKIRIDSGGEFRIVAKVTDRAGREAVASTSVYAWSNTYVNWPRKNNDRIDVLADQPEYKVGQTAKLLVKSPFQGAGVKALVTVEREQIISKKLIAIESSAQPIEIPITEELIPNAYVSVVIVKPRIGETFDENGLDTGAPAFRAGYAKLLVETAPKKLTVSIETDKEKYLPGEKVSATLTTRDSEGKPVRAELSLGTVDMSLLALTGFSLPDLVGWFYAERGLGIESAHLLLNLIDRYKPGSKGGGGGAPETSVRGNFLDTASWNPVIVTGDDGRATVSFTLPDNLTTWQLLAIAHTKDHLFGAAEKTIIETKRVIVRPVRPRFGVIHDAVTIGAIVHNATDAEREFSVSLTGSGFTAASKKPQSVSIAAGAQEKLSFPVTIDPGEKVTLHFLAESEDLRDEVIESFPVYPYGTPQSSATTGITEDRTQESILVPSKEDAPEGTVSLTVSPTLATYLPKGLEYLVKYPYGCIEQTISSFLPSVVLHKMQGFSAFRFVDEKALADVVSTGLQRIYLFQRGDGGFGYWMDSPRSYPYVSAYALSALQTTRDAGYSVDASAIERTRKYLNNVLHEKQPSFESEEISLATRAYILSVLSETGPIDASLVSNLYDLRSKLPLFSRAQLLQTLKRSNAGSSRISQLEKEILDTARVDARGIHFEENDDMTYASLMNTNVRTTAIILRALIAVSPDNPLIPNITRYLLSVRRDGHWDTTQSTVESLLALIDQLKSTNELRDAAFTATADLSGEQVMRWVVSKENVLSKSGFTRTLDQMTRGTENLLSIAKDGTGRLYYDLVLSYFFAADDLPPAEEGISISRSIVPLAGQKADLTVGNTYAVTLTITAPEDRNFVAVESPLPAGFEAIDLSLQTSQQNLLSDQASTESWNREYYESGLWRFNHKELRDDSVFLFADELPAGVYQYRYLVRATTPGSFLQRPAHAFEMYFPETFGQTEGKRVTIRE
ncbi:MAG: Ig-like domain-containing protein [Candidatus Peregrinibacteria bacterium]